MTGYSSAELYRQGYYDGMRRALQIVKQTDSSPQTRCSERAFGAAKRRLARVLAGAVARNEPSDAALVRNERALLPSIAPPVAAVLPAILVRRAPWAAQRCLLRHRTLPQ